MMYNRYSIGRFPVGKRAVVIGAGVSGLSAAQALANHFEEVLVLDRDELPSGSTPRAGAPQGTQAHGLLGGAIKALEELFPGFGYDLVQAGAVPVNPGFETLLEYPGLDPFPRGEWNWVIYCSTRPLIELTMRRRVARQRNVLLRGGCRALEIVGTSDGSQVTGVRREALDGVQDTISADFVIDASRHGTLTLSFLGLSGQLPEETTIGVDIRYATGLFALPHGALGEFKAVVTFPKAPEGVHYGYLLPVEDHRFQLLLVGRGDDAPPVDRDAFVAYAQKLGTPTIWKAMQDAKLLGKIARYGFPESSWRHFGRLDRFPRGLLTIGDTICRLNPVYGQGITVAVKQANILRRLLSTNASKAEPLAALAQQFLTEAEALIEEPWTISAIPDFIYPQTRGERPGDLEYKLKSQFALARIATRDPSVWQLLSEVRHLLKPPAVLEEPGLARRVEAEMARV